jgi:hypothetical protein
MKKAQLIILLAAMLVGCSMRKDKGDSKETAPRFSQQEFLDFVTPGRTIEEVTNRFGDPKVVTNMPESAVMEFENAAMDFMTRGMNGRKHKFWSGSVSFTNGVVEAATIIEKGHVTVSW